MIFLWGSSGAHLLCALALFFWACGDTQKHKEKPADVWIPPQHLSHVGVGSAKRVCRRRSLPRGAARVPLRGAAVVRRFSTNLFFHPLSEFETRELRERERERAGQDETTKNTAGHPTAPSAYANAMLCDAHANAMPYTGWKAVTGRR